MRFHLGFTQLYLSYLSPIGQMYLTSIFFKLVFLGKGGSFRTFEDRVFRNKTKTPKSIYSSIEAEC